MSASSTSQVPSNNDDDVEYQENVISDKCNKYYNAWKRQRTRLLSSNNQSFTENSRDEKFTIGLIGEEGGYLELRNGDIQLYIPPGAKSDKGYVFMYADLVQYNLVKYDVIICGPPGQQFNNPVLLRFPKPKSQDDNVLESNLVKLSVQELGKPLKWRSLEDTTTDGSFFLEDGDILLHLNHFTGIKVDVGVQTSSHTVFFTAFLEQQDQRHFWFRVFFSIYSTLEVVINGESRRRSNSQQIGNWVKIGSFRLEDEVTVNVIHSEGCQANPPAYTICVRDILSDCNYISRQFMMESSASLVESSSFNFQVGVGSKMVHKDRVRMVVEKKNEEYHDKYLEPQFTCSPGHPSILQQQTRRNLSIHLDVLTEGPDRPCDYRGLAELMGETSIYIEWLGSPKNSQQDSSPTNLLLSKWEIDCKNRKLTPEAALTKLERLLNDLKHNPCIEILKRANNPMRSGVTATNPGALELKGPQISSPMQLLPSVGGGPLNKPRASTACFMPVPTTQRFLQFRIARIMNILEWPNNPISSDVTVMSAHGLNPGGLQLKGPQISPRQLPSVVWDPEKPRAYAPCVTPLLVMGLQLKRHCIACNKIISERANNPNRLTPGIKGPQSSQMQLPSVGGGGSLRNQPFHPALRHCQWKENQHRHSVAVHHK